MLRVPDHRTDPPAPPSTAPAPGPCGTPGCLWGPGGPAGGQCGLEQQGGRAAVWGLQVGPGDREGFITGQIPSQNFT